MRRTADQVVFALLYSANVVMIFAHGLFGLGSVFTGVYLASLTAFLILVGWWFWRGSNTVDYLVAALAALFAISLAVHPPHDFKPIALLVLSLAAYPAARGLVARSGTTATPILQPAARPGEFTISATIARKT